MSTSIPQCKSSQEVNIVMLDTALFAPADVGLNPVDEG